MRYSDIFFDGWNNCRICTGRGWITYNSSEHTMNGVRDLGSFDKPCHVCDGSGKRVSAGNKL
jgi:hypothetical protein